MQGSPALWRAMRRGQRRLRNPRRVERRQAERGRGRENGKAKGRSFAHGTISIVLLAASPRTSIFSPPLLPCRSPVGAWPGLNRIGYPCVPYRLHGFQTDSCVYRSSRVQGRYPCLLCQGECAFPCKSRTFAVDECVFNDFRLRKPSGGRGVYGCCSTERMFPAGSLNQAIEGPGPRAIPFSSCSKPS